MTTSVSIFNPDQLALIRSIRPLARDMSDGSEIPEPTRRMSPLPYYGQTDIRNRLVVWLSSQNWVRKVSDKEGTPAEFQFLMPFSEDEMGNYIRSATYPIKGLLDKFLSELYKDGKSPFVHQAAPEGCNEKVAYLEARYTCLSVEAIKLQIIELYCGIVANWLRETKGLS